MVLIGEFMLRIGLSLLLSCYGLSAVFAVDGMMSEPISPIPLTITVDAEKIALGKKLFEDPIFSKDNKLACSDCHNLEKGGADNRFRSLTNSGDLDIINTPTIYNVAFNIRFGWAGQFKTLAEQLNSSLHNSRHGNSNWEALLAKLQDSADYADAFQKIYGRQKIQRLWVEEVMIEYQKSMTTPNASFDRYLRGDSQAISETAKRGYRLFKKYGCIACHQGINVGGNMFQKIGIFGNYFKNRDEINPTDYGRFNVSGLEEDKFVFRVPGLRNVELTAPYFHDGHTRTLEEAVELMARHQLGREINEQDRDAIIAFLKTLTGEIPVKAFYVWRP